MECLQQLELNFAKCFFVNDDVFEFFEIMVEGKLPALKSLSLKFNFCDMGQEGMEDFVESIGTHLHALQYLSLIFIKCDVDNKGIEAVGSSIGEHLSHLRGLTLNFRECKQITKKGVEDLVSKIKENLKELEQLSLTFANGRFTDEEDIEALEKQLDFIKNCDINLYRMYDSDMSGDFDTYDEFNDFDTTSNGSFRERPAEESEWDTEDWIENKNEEAEDLEDFDNNNN